MSAAKRAGKTNKRRGPGRPLFVEGQPKDVIFSIRLSRSERNEIAEATKRAGVRKDSDWARDTLLFAARARSR